MTPLDFDAAADPAALLPHLGGRATDRRLRLFACGLGRLACDPVIDSTGRWALAAAEGYADGRRTKKDVLAAWSAANRRRRAVSVLRRVNPDAAAEWAALTVVRWACRLPAGGGGCGPLAATAAAALPAGLRAAGAEVARCVFGNPRRPVRGDAYGLPAGVRRLAEEVEASRAFGRLPELADALDAAGWDDPWAVAHLRAGGPHAAGCWALDVAIGRLLPGG